MAPSNFVCALLETSSLHDMCVLPTTLSPQYPTESIRPPVTGRVSAYMIEQIYIDETYQS